MDNVDLIGDDGFVANFQPSAEAPEIPAGVEQIPITVDSQGNVIGDTSHLDPNILAQLSTPESQAKIRDMYRSSRYQKEPARAPKYINEGQRRDFSHLRPAGMDNKTFRSLRKQTFRKLTKQTIKVQRSIEHGR